MEVGFADTFWDSLKTIRRHNTWWYKIYEFFRYTTPRFIKNVWRFRKPLTNHYWWDHHSMLQFMEVSLTNMSDNLEKRGLEIEEPRMKKVIAMRRAIQLIKNYNDSNYIEMAESELGEIILHDFEFEDVPDKPGFSRLVDTESDEEKKHNRKVYERSNEIEELEWIELWSILKGQDHKEYIKLHEEDELKEIRNDNLWNEWFNGSGIKTWWD